MSEEDDSYDAVRDIPGLKALIGRRLDDISCTDRGESPSEIYMLFDNGTIVTIRLPSENEDPIFSFDTIDWKDDDA